MKKTTLVESAIVILSGALAYGLGHQLSDHGVSVATIVAAVAFTLSSGLALAEQISRSMRTTLYTCPAKGCPVSIRASGTSRDELDRLQAHATDHSKHGATT